MKFNAKKLKELRIASGLSMSVMAARCSLTKSSISLYESGKRQPSMSVITTIADILSVPDTVLLTLELRKPVKDELP